MLEKIKKYIGIIILLSLIVIILVIYQVSGVKKSVLPTPSPTSSPTNSFPTTQTQQYSQTPSSYKEPTYSQPVTDSSGQVDESSPEVQTAITNKSKLKPQLPIYVENFQTTSGLNTTLNVYTTPEDPNYLIHIEIYGTNYSDPNILTPNNKNALAFIDSFNKIKNLLLADGVSIHNIYFIFGAKPYIQNTADNLIQKYGLLN
jgi:hypothetical protein